jgi:hypothetical protein
MRPLPVEPFLKVYMLVRQNGTYLSPAGYDANAGLGSGFFISQSDAEMFRTRELLALKPDSTDKLHIYELEIPNPAYKE